MKGIWLPLGVAAAGLLAVAGVADAWDVWPFANRQGFTDDAYVRGDVTIISAETGGRLVEARVGDFDQVRAGQPLFRIDDAQPRAALDRAEASLGGAADALASNGEQARLQTLLIAEAEADLASARAAQLRAVRDDERQAALLKAGFTTGTSRDAAQQAATQATAGVARAEAAIAAARQQLVVLASQRHQLEAGAAAARADRAAAAAGQGYTLVRAPFDAQAGERQARVGQYVRPGTQLIALVPLDRVWIVANFRENQLPRIRLGDAVEVTVDAVPDATFRGRVAGFAPASGADFALVPPDNATANFTKVARRFGVRIALDPAELKGRLRPGMSAEVQVMQR